MLEGLSFFIIRREKCPHLLIHLSNLKQALHKLVIIIHISLTNRCNSSCVLYVFFPVCELHFYVFIYKGGNCGVRGMPRLFLLCFHKSLIRINCYPGSLCLYKIGIHEQLGYLNWHSMLKMKITAINRCDLYKILETFVSFKKFQSSARLLQSFLFFILI